MSSASNYRSASTERAATPTVALAPAKRLRALETSSAKPAFCSRVRAPHRRHCRPRARRFHVLLFERSLRRARRPALPAGAGARARAEEDRPPPPTAAPFLHDLNRRTSKFLKRTMTMNAAQTLT